MFDAEEYRKSDENQRGQRCCPMVSTDICRMESDGFMGIQRTLSMSIGITVLVVNLTSDKCSVNQICRAFRAMKRNSSFKAQMT